MSYRIKIRSIHETVYGPYETTLAQAVEQALSELNCAGPLCSVTCITVEGPQ